MGEQRAGYDQKKAQGEERQLAEGCDRKKHHGEGRAKKGTGSAAVEAPTTPGADLAGSEANGCVKCSMGHSSPWQTGGKPRRGAALLGPPSNDLFTPDGVPCSPSPLAPTMNQL
ncbi:hypothetical protein VTN77DRAFT_313 [Rasamsonia byssochlamydoides]|uniref:uncharacterized protein n=1 Tax=Rasamsonia byssochlamydoides TaxID=89139 RepID=UPI003743A8A5